MPTLTDPDLDGIRHDYEAALMARDSHRARSLIDRAVGEGASPAAIDLDVLTPTLHAFGDSWARGEVSVAHEHYASGVTEGLMAVMAARMRQPPAGGRLAVVACPHGERHGLAARMLGDFLESVGWEVIVVGSDVPVRDLLGLIADEQPDVAAVSVTLPELVEHAAELLGALGVTDPRPYLIAGGQALEDAEPIGADAVVQDIPGFLELVRLRFPPLPD